jgi:hypothetical protein
VSQAIDNEVQTQQTSGAGNLGMLGRFPGARFALAAPRLILDTVGSSSPQTRRAAVYLGAGVLGAVGVVEWPVAAAIAVAVWISQQRPIPATTSDNQPSPPAQTNNKPLPTASNEQPIPGSATTSPKRRASGRPARSSAKS